MNVCPCGLFLYLGAWTYDPVTYHFLLNNDCPDTGKPDP